MNDPKLIAEISDEKGTGRIYMREVIPGKPNVKPYHATDWAGMHDARTERAVKAMLAANDDSGRYSLNFWRYLAHVALCAADADECTPTPGGVS